jgi:hypothetical protein
MNWRASRLHHCVAATLLGIVGCGGGWKTVTEGMPWCGPGERIVEKHRATGGWNTTIYETHWCDSSGRKLQFHEVAAATEDYLERCGFVAAVEAQPRQEGVAPLITTVSLNPTVVLISTWDVSRAAKENVELFPPGTKAGYYPKSVLLGPFAFGSRAFCRGPIQWCSPDLEQPPQEVHFSKAGQAEIDLPDGKLLLQRDENFCTVTRS